MYRDYCFCCEINQSACLRNWEMRNRKNMREHFGEPLISFILRTLQWYISVLSWFPWFYIKRKKRKLAPDNWLPHHPHCFISLRAEFSHDSHNRTTRKDRAMINFFNTLQILRSAKLVRISLPIIALPNCFIFNETKVSEYQRIEWVRRCSRFLAPVWNRTQSLLPAFY